MRIYISGPMTGLPEFNYPAFYKAADRIWKAGHMPLNPADSFRGKKTMPRRDYMREDIKLLLMADAIVQLPGWSRSKGARLEWAIARELELSVYRL